MLRRLLSYQLAVMMLLTNIGIPVFTHVCHTQGKSWSSAFIPANSCCSKSDENQSYGFCHLPSAKEEGAAYEARPCCENHSGFVQLNPEVTLSGISSLSKPFDKVFASGIYEGQLRLEFNLAVCKTIVRSHGPPVVLYGRGMLIFQQVFRC